VCYSLIGLGAFFENPVRYPKNAAEARKVSDIQVRQQCDGLSSWIQTQSKETVVGFGKIVHKKHFYRARNHALAEACSRLESLICHP
jgi:hypothetical protein